MRFEETAAETNISTHTLTWSVTMILDWHILEDMMISTHTLTWSVTL